MTRTPTSRRWPLFLISIVVVGAGLFAVGRWSVPVGDRPGFAAPDVAPVIANPQIGPVEVVTALSAKIQYQDTVTVLPSAVDGAYRQVITSAPLQRGDAVALGDQVVSVAAAPVFALKGTVPSFRVMVLGDSGPDVTQLADSLTELGYLARPPKTMTSAVVAATARFLADRSVAVPVDTLMSTGIDGRMFAFIPDFPAIVIDTDLLAGTDLDTTKNGLILGQGAIELVVAPSQNNINLLPGTSVSATCDAVTITGKTTSTTRVWQAAAASTATSLDASAQTDGRATLATGYVVSTAADLSTLLKATCTATATAGQGGATMITVPAAAIFTSTDGTSNLHIQTRGTEFRTVPIQLGSSISGWVQLVNPPRELTATTPLIVGDS